jgi:cyclase
MEASVNRCVRLLLSLGFAVGAAAATAAQRGPEPPFTLKTVGPNVWAAIDNPKAETSSAANAGVIVGDDGVVVVDTFANLEGAAQLLAEIRQHTRLPIKFVINTHYHADHVAGNHVFIDNGAVILAHRNVYDWIHAENLRMLVAAAGNGVVNPELRTRMEGFVAPSLLFEDSVTLYLGGREIRVRRFPGHTGGDAVVIVPDAKVMFTGDLFWNHNVPNTIDASTKPWIETLNTLARDERDYVFVPGHGEIGIEQDVAIFRGYLASLREWVSDAQAVGKSGDAVVEAVLPVLAARYGQWDYFKYLAPLNIRDMDAELNGTKRIPAERPAK